MRTGLRNPMQAAVAMLAFLAMLSPAGCAGAASKPTALKGVEVRQYQGQRLDTISDFQENSIKGPQNVDRTTYRLKVDGAVAKPSTYTYQQVLARETTHTKVVELDCVEGWSVRILWEGVLLSELIDRSGPQIGAVTVIFHAVDGYTTSLPLAYVRSRDILLAYKMNGVEIPPERGFPFMVVAEDKWGYKWCKWVDDIELSSSASYLGYWESRGYSPEGDLSKPSFGP